MPSARTGRRRISDVWSGHSVCVDLVGEVFIPVGYLVNGATIAQIEVDEVSYWHVELDSHDILLANNLPAESYMAIGNRGFFEERRDLLPANDEERERTHADFCRPVVLDGPVLAFARQRLQTRAEAIGWMPEHDPNLRLLVDGQVRRPLSDGDTAVFMFPAAAADVRLASTTFVPAHIGVGDSRELGICLFGLTFAGSGGGSRRVSIDDARLGGGIHDGEAKSGTQWRWTKGELVLDPQFWADMTGHVAVFIEHSSAATRRWNAPSERIEFARPAEIASSKERAQTLFGGVGRRPDRLSVIRRLERPPARRSFLLRRRSRWFEAEELRRNGASSRHRWKVSPGAGDRRVPSLPGRR